MLLTRVQIGERKTAAGEPFVKLWLVTSEIFIFILQSFHVSHNDTNNSVAEEPFLPGIRLLCEMSESDTIIVHHRISDLITFQGSQNVLNMQLHHLFSSLLANNLPSLWQGDSEQATAAVWIVSLEVVKRLADFLETFVLQEFVHAISHVPSAWQCRAKPRSIAGALTVTDSLLLSWGRQEASHLHHPQTAHVEWGSPRLSAQLLEDVRTGSALPAGLHEQFQQRRARSHGAVAVGESPE